LLSPSLKTGYQGVPEQSANVRSEVLLCETIVKAGIFYLRESHWKKQRTFLLRDLGNRSARFGKIGGVRNDNYQANVFAGFRGWKTPLLKQEG
jgi:hypothetical protein